MATFGEMAYMVQDELKTISDDSTYTLEHIYFLLSKYRASLLVLKYQLNALPIPNSNNQQIKIPLHVVSVFGGVDCYNDVQLMSKDKIPNVLIGNPSVTTLDPLNSYYITMVSEERIRFVGHNKWLKPIIYCCIGSDGYLKFKASTDLHLYLKNVILNGVFEDAYGAAQLIADNCGYCDVAQLRFPIEEGLIPLVIQSVVKELLGALYRPEDPYNNANDDISNIQNFIYNHTKKNLNDLIENNE